MPPETLLASANVPDRPKLIIGIDPGLTGAVAILEPHTMKLRAVMDIPTYKTETKARKSGFFKHVDLAKTAQMLDMYSKETLFAVIEAPRPRSGQGLGSTFRFGKTCGGLEGILAGLSIPILGVPSSSWKMAMNLSSDKQESIDLANKHFPAYKRAWALKKHNDRAEAVLLALYGMKHLLSMRG